MFKHLRHLAKATLASIILVTPFAAQAAVDMNITSFTDNPDPVTAGGEFHYLLTVENSGDQDAPNADLIVTIPADVTVTNVSPGACTGTSPVTCNFGTLTGTLVGGTPINVDITMTATNAGPLSINSTATTSTTASDSNNGNNSSIQGTTVNRGSDLSVSFNASSASTASGGSTFAYKLDVVNGGPNDAANEKVILTLPPQVTYATSSGSGWSCSASGQTVTCDRSSALINGSTAPLLTVNAKATGGSVGTFTALATVSSTTEDGDGNNNSDTHDLAVTAGADMAINKSVSPDPVIAEQPVTFTLNVTNNGPMPSDTVVVTDTLPANYTAISASGTGWTCNVVGQTVTCNADASLAQGSAPTITINATAPLNANIPAAGTSHSNTASLTSNTPDPFSGNDSKTINYNIGRYHADLSITKSKTPNPVAQGSAMSSTIRVKNNGPRNATGTIKVEDTLAAGESYSSASPGTGTGWTCSYNLADDATGGVVTCTNPGPLTLNAFSSYLTIPTKAVGTGAMQNTACTSTSAGQAPTELDFNAANDCATAGGTTSTGGTADLELVKIVEDLAPGNNDGTLQDTEDTLTYTLTVTNRNDTGDTGADATNVVLSDPIPMYASSPANYGGTVVTATPSQGAACTIGTTITCNLGTLTNGASANVVITVARPMKDGTWTNTATAFSQDIGDPNRANNTASASTTVEPVADVAMESKTQSGPIKAGVEATYVLNFKNRGVSTAQGIEVVDTFTNLNGLTYTFISATSTLSGSICTHDVPTKKVTCTGGSLNSLQSKSVTIKIRPDFSTSLTYPLNLENTATITTTTLETDGPAGAVNPNNSQSATLVVNDAEVDMLVQKQDFVDPIFYDSVTAANNVITYEIKVTNQGPSYGTGIQFVDTLTPAAGQTLTFLCDKALQGDSCTPATPGQVCDNQNTAINSPTNMTCNLPDMTTGAITYRYLDFRVDSLPTAGGSTVQNSVTVSSNEAESLSGNNTAGDQTTVRVRADVEVTSKTPEFPTVNISQPFNWTIVITNNGPDISEETTLDDTLPAGMILTGPAVPAQGSCPTGIAGETVISCDLGLLNNGASTTITVPVKITTFAASYNNTASVTTSAIDQVPANNSKTNSVAVQKSSLAGFVYEDNSNDGSKDGGEAGINGVMLTISGTDIYGNPVTGTTTTNGSGAYIFDNLAPSDANGYTVTETHPTAYFDGLDDNGAGTVNANSKTTDVISGIDVPAATDVTDYLFGELKKSSLTGFVYNDTVTTGNNIKDPGEAGIPSITVTLTGTDDLGNTITPVDVQTDGNGQFTFPDLRPGTYTITETQQPPTFDDGTDTAGDLGGTVGADVITAIPLLTGQDGVNYLFGETGAGGSVLAGVVYIDANDNGIQDSGETGIPSVDVTLTDANSAFSQTLQTDANGAFTFSALTPSTGYILTETHPATYFDGQESVSGVVIANSKTTDVISGIDVQLNEIVTGHLFGELTGGSISGFVYNDGSNDGTMDPENPGIESVTITLSGTDDLGNPVNQTTTTDQTGAYSFTDLRPSDNTGYTLTETQPTGYRDNIDTVGLINGSPEGTLAADTANDFISDIKLPAGGSGTEYNFADSNTAIAGNVYVDANNDGVKDSGETGIAGVTLTLTGNDTNGNPVNLTTSTDANGAYSFTGMIASDANGYSVTETQPSAWADGIDTAGDAGGSTATNDVISNIQIGASTFATNYNFGEIGAALSGVVYNDNGDDGQQGDSDPGIPGVPITITGTDLNGNPVTQTTVTGDDGSYRFTNLPVPDASGFTITETQPAGVNDGQENTSNVITGVQITTPGVEETGFNFGEIVPSSQTASVSGRVHDRDDPNTTYASWTVEIIKNGVVVATTITDANSGYLFEGLQPGPGYEIHFRHPESRAVFGVIYNVNLTANTELPDQNFPLDPSGVVYDSVTRQPVPGAVVTISAPGFNPATDLIGGVGNVSQTVGADGMYKFLLNPSAPQNEDYTLTVVQPTGYLPPTSLNIPAPCAGPLVVGAIPDPAAIQPQATAPGTNTPLHDSLNCPTIGASGTQYYLSFNLNATSADVLNNHIPLDPEGQLSGLTVVKTTPKVNVTRGELVPYNVIITNNLTTPITNIRIRDQIPPGFKYVANSAILDGTRVEPVVNNRELTWPAQDFAVGESHEVTLILVIGAGVGEGEYVNQAWGINGLTGSTATRIAEATVRIVPDPIFDCSDLIGKVFDDKNTNGYQDEGEAGLPGIRVATARGLVITTDSNGRYHVPCAAVPNEMRGSNFIMKLDEQTLPSGYRVTTENPRVVRLTRGKLAKLNFGAAIHRVVRLDLSATAFDQDSNELRSDYGKHMQKLLDILSKEPSVLRVAYVANGEDKKLVKQRLKTFRKHLKSMWGDCDCNHELIIEDEVLWGDTATRGSASTGRAK